MPANVIDAQGRLVLIPLRRIPSFSARRFYDLIRRPHTGSLLRLRLKPILD
jgi:hypothetical protein